MNPCDPLKVSDCVGLSDARWVESANSYDFVPRVDRCALGHARQRTLGSKFIPGHEPYFKVVIYYCQYCKEEYFHLVDVVVPLRT